MKGIHKVKKYLQCLSYLSSTHVHDDGDDDDFDDALEFATKMMPWSLPPNPSRAIIILCLLEF